MDIGGQADQVKFMIRDRASNFTGAFDAVLADAGIRTVLCNIRTLRMHSAPRTAPQNDLQLTAGTQRNTQPSTDSILLS
jgi:hypothetical protein